MNPERHEEIAAEVYQKYLMGTKGIQLYIAESLSTLAAGYEAELAAKDREIQEIKKTIPLLSGTDQMVVGLAYHEQMKKIIEEKDREIREFRAIDRHKDKDWGKWYALYHSRVDRIAELEKELAAKDSENQHLAELVRSWGEAAKEKDREIQRLQSLIKQYELILDPGQKHNAQSPALPTEEELERIAEGLIEHEVDVALSRPHSLGGTLKQILIPQIVAALRRATTGEDLLSALKKIQWGSCDGCGLHAYCPECLERSNDSHKEDCCVGIALRRAGTGGKGEGA